MRFGLQCRHSNHGWHEFAAGVEREEQPVETLRPHADSFGQIGIYVHACVVLEGRSVRFGRFRLQLSRSWVAQNCMGGRASCWRGRSVRLDRHGVILVMGGTELYLGSVGQANDVWMGLDRHGIVLLCAACYQTGGVPLQSSAFQTGLDQHSQS